MASRVLVVGATGATGRHVVQQLLDQGQDVKVIVRSKQRMIDFLVGSEDANKLDKYNSKLEVAEATLLELSDEELTQQVKGCGAVVCCLGHTLDFQGLWGHPRRLVTDAVRRLSMALMETRDASSHSSPKFVLMGSEGVAHPAGTDDVRPAGDRILLWLFRHMMSPVADNEEAASFLYHDYPQEKGLEWVIVRPTNLIDGAVSDYILFDKPKGGLFTAGQVVTRANVAKFMVDLLTDNSKWSQYKFQMPSIHDRATNQVNA